MRLFVELIVLWTILAIVLGIAGRTWLDQAWRQQVEDSFRRDATAALAIVEASDWPTIPEDDPAWESMQQRLGMGVVTLPATESASSPVETNRVTTDAADTSTAANGSGPTKIQWSRAARTGQRMSLILPLNSDHIEAGSLQLSRNVPVSTFGLTWWTVWGLLNGTAYLLAFVGYVSLQRESQWKRRFLTPWFQALESRRDEGPLLPHAETHQSLFCMQMDSVADAVNRVYSDLQTANDRNELVLGNLREGVLALDEKSQVLLLNRALRRLLDLTDDEFLYRPLLEVIRTPAIAKLATKTLTEKIPSSDQLEFGQPTRHLHILARPLPLGPNRSGVLFTVRDETLLRRVDMVKRDFVANASHELKTPLAAIRAYAETLQMGALDDPVAAEDFVNNIIQQADRMDGLVQGMLQLSRVEVGGSLRNRKFEVTQAIEPCIDAGRVLAQRKNVEIHADFPARPVEIVSDRDGFQTIISNLLSNAVRYTPEGGRVEIYFREADGHLLVEVRDTGIGMAAEDLDRVFERFYRAEKDRSSETGGTGLGLSIVKHLSIAQGGEVHLKSKPGKGARFEVRLPAASAE